jgi:hypothetical protein
LGLLPPTPFTLQLALQDPRQAGVGVAAVGAQRAQRSLPAQPVGGQLRQGFIIPLQQESIHKLLGDLTPLL